ncbi:MAG: hypothetical protein M3453_04090, partial [Pseudomonadota bacterium]|nr:hypothetical protein [Pseudomonadota bacterium]
MNWGVQMQNVLYTMPKAALNSWIITGRISAVILSLIIPVSAQAGLLQPDNTPLKQFGFASGPDVKTVPQFNRYLDVTKSVLGEGSIVRTGLGWDP